MRQVDLLSKIINIFDEFHMNITWGDQCLLNIYFHYYPGNSIAFNAMKIFEWILLEQIYEFSCDWNYRPDHCIYENNCRKAQIDGIKILHGCRSAFHNDKYEEFKSIYQVIEQWKFNSTLKSSLLLPMKINLQKFSSTNCGKSHELFTKHFSQQISSFKSSSSQTSYHIALIENLHWTFLAQSSILLKSIRLFSNKPIHLHLIVSQNQTRNEFSKRVSALFFEQISRETSRFLDCIIELFDNVLFNKNNKSSIWIIGRNFLLSDVISKKTRMKLSETITVSTC